MENKHTPGPWILRRGFNFFNVEANGELLAKVYLQSTDGEGNYANAELIASAPSLQSEIDRLKEFETKFREKLEKERQAFDKAYWPLQEEVDRLKEEKKELMKYYDKLMEARSKLMFIAANTFNEEVQQQSNTAWQTITDITFILTRIK